MYLGIKRFLDISFSSVLLLILLPFLLLVALILLLTGEGAVWYFQKRVGYNNRPFYIWKFATMLRDSPNMGTGTITLRNDPRVTSIGRILRITKINELPQLVNVIKGEMSLVGPRPQVERGFQAFPSHVQERIYNIRPGITGIGSVIFRDEERFLSTYHGDPRAFYQKIIAPYKGELECWYQDNLSLTTDIKLVVSTALVIIFPRLDMYKFFRDLPEPPSQLYGFNYQSAAIEKKID